MSAGRLAGIDYGSKRIGVALTDPERRMASPFEIYARRDPPTDAAYFRRLAADERIVRFVVGLPVHLDGRESQKSTEAREFGKWLAETAGVEVVYFDERFTTTEAEHLLADAKMTRKRRKARRDMLAAQILLTAYLEAGEPSEESSGAARRMTKESILRNGARGPAENSCRLPLPLTLTPSKIAVSIRPPPHPLFPQALKPPTLKPLPHAATKARLSSRD